MAGLWILVFLFLGVFVWSIVPSRIVENFYSVDLNRPIFQDQVCQIEESFPNISIHTRHPAFLHLGTRAPFEVSVNKEADSELKRREGCIFSLELFLDLSNISVVPNERLVQPMVDEKEQFFVFDLQAGDLKRNQEGKLWIYLNSTSPDTHTSSTRTPLFVIPVEIEIRSLLGIPMVWLRLFSLCSVFLLASLKVFTGRLR